MMLIYSSIITIKKISREWCVKMPRRKFDKKHVIRELVMRLKFVLYEPRWTIIKIIGKDQKSTNEIYEELKSRGFLIPRSNLYYYLSSLQDMGIIELAGYKEEKGGAPEKIWRLKTTCLGVDLLSGELVSKLL